MPVRGPDLTALSYPAPCGIFEVLVRRGRGQSLQRGAGDVRRPEVR